MKRLSMLIVFAGVVSLVIFFNLTKSEQEIHLTAVGDILLARDVEKIMEEEGLDYPYRGLKSFFPKKTLYLVIWKIHYTKEITRLPKNLT